MRKASAAALTGLVFLSACGERESAAAAAESAASALDSTANAASASADAPPPESADIDSSGPLSVGDPAPPLSAARWFRGDARDAVTPGRVTLVEFWATWCGPCIAAMPHISELATTLGDEGLDVIGVSLDRGDDAAQVVERFIRDRGEIVAFDVMLDDGQTNRAWFEAAGRTGIPASFVVAQDGRIAWMGHPMEAATQGDGLELDRVITGLLDGTYDIDSRVSAAAREAEERLTRAAQVEKLSSEMGRLWSAGDRLGVLEYIDRIVAIDPENSRDLAQRKIEILLYELGEAGEALDAARAILDGPYSDDTGMKLTLASLFSGAADPGEPGRAFAIEAARDVVATTDGTEPNSLVVLAEALFASGDPRAAADTLRAAMDLVSDDSPAFQTYELVLSRYLAASGEESPAAPGAPAGSGG
ncbi:MAG: redoxin family protein [Planctomycetota bacterium]